MKISDRIFKPEIIDKIIFVFMILFFVSVNNSIFVNQIGYIIPLFFIFYRYFKTGENQFSKTGLEAYFLIFILLEIISANVSQYRSVALENLVKRILQIFVFYTVVVAATDAKKAKLFVKIYMAAALITILVYMGFAYKHFIKHLYATETRGPSPFQYVMTAGGLMMFTSLFFFAFYMNKKKWNKEKYYYLFGSIIAFLAVISSYTRAAWLGMFAGIVAILIMKKKWWWLGAAGLAFILVLFIDPEASKVVTYKYENGTFVKKTEMNTDGKAVSVLADSSGFILADYQKGIKRIINGQQVDKLDLPNPVGRLDDVNNKYLLASLVDSRFYVIDKSGKLNSVNEFISPGQTTDYKATNGFIYVCDKDSGLTVFRSLDNLIDRVNFPEIKNVGSCFVGANYFACYNTDKNLLVYSLKDSLPNKIIYTEKDESGSGVLFGNANSFLFGINNGLKLYNVINDSVKLIKENAEIKGAYRFSNSSDKLYVADLLKNLYVLQYPFNGDIKIINKIRLDYVPASIDASGNNLYLTYVKYNRVKTMFDPYWVTNIERTNQFRTALRIFKAHPVFGIGDIGVEHQYAKYKNYYEKENFGHLHNNYTQFLVIFGIVGFIFMMFFLVKIFKIHLQMYNLFKETDFISSYTLAAFACFIAFLFAGLAEWNFGDQEIITVIWFTLGLNIAFYKDYLRTKARMNG
jgi:O-antigen ligase